jgi:putative hydrolase of HD superfamily
LDTGQKDEFQSLWNEFEKRETNDAKFAAIFDRLEPLVQNYMYEGYTWKKYHITYEMVIEKNRHIKEASKKLWDFALKLLEKAVEKGYLGKGGSQ